MKFTVELEVGDAPDPQAVLQFLSWAHELDKGGVKFNHLQSFVAGGEIQGAESPAVTDLIQGADWPEEPDAVSEIAAPVAGAKRKPGRPRKTAAPAAAEEAASPPLPFPPAVVQPDPPPPPAVPAGMALPPGITMPGGPAPVAPVVQPQAAAMPVVPPAAEGASTSTLEDLREAFRQSNAARPGKAFVLLKASAWPDGTPKGTWFTVESIPAELRERAMYEMSLL